jgi:hypothetical protein
VVVRADVDGAMGVDSDSFDPTGVDSGSLDAQATSRPEAAVITASALTDLATLQRVLRLSRPGDKCLARTLQPPLAEQGAGQPGRRRTTFPVADYASHPTKGTEEFS